MPPTGGPAGVPGCCACAAAGIACTPCLLPLKDLTLTQLGSGIVVPVVYNGNPGAALWRSACVLVSGTFGPQWSKMTLDCDLFNRLHVTQQTYLDEAHCLSGDTSGTAPTGFSPAPSPAPICSPLSVYFRFSTTTTVNSWYLSE